MFSLLVSSVFWQQASFSDSQFQYHEAQQIPIEQDYQYTHYRDVNPTRVSIPSKHRSQMKAPKRGFIRPIEKTASILIQKKDTAIRREQKLTLVIAPHPDDAILCCGKTIQNRINSGVRVKVVYLTNGDALANESTYDAQQYALTRQQESQTAMGLIGVKRKDLVFLGFPDAQLSQLSNQVLKSHYTGFSSALQASLFYDSPYTQIALKQNLKTLFRQWGPTEIFIPSEVHDEHPDHKVAGKLAKEVIQELGITPKVYSYTVHQNKCEQEVCPANQDTDREKLRWVQVFQSQMPDNHHRRFLEQFAKIREAFGKILLGYTGLTL